MPKRSRNLQMDKVSDEQGSDEGAPPAWQTANPSRRTAKLRRRVNSTCSNASVDSMASNRFAALVREETKEIDRKKTERKKESNPPPIFISPIDDIKSMLASLRKEEITNFSH